MKKHILFFCLLLLTSLAGRSAVYEVYKQQGLTGTDLYYNAGIHNIALSWCVSHPGNDTIYLDSTKRWHIVDPNNALTDNVFLSGAKGKQNIFIDDYYRGNPVEPIFICYGASNYGAAGLSFTGIDNRKQIGAVFQCNSYGANGDKTNKGIFFKDCDFSNLNATDVIKFGNGGGNHFNDSIIFSNDDFTDIFNPLLPIPHSEQEEYHMGIQCDAIDNEQTTLREWVYNCRFARISGRGGAGYGWTQNRDTIATNPLYGNWNWHHNTFNRCFKFLEFNGGALMRGITVTDNYGFDWTSDNGHATSLTGFQTVEMRNKWIGCDRSGCERYGIEGRFDDTIIIRKWTPGCGGTPTNVYFQKKGMEVGGYSHTISDYLVYEGYSLSDNVRLMPVLLTGYGIPTDNHPTSWKGQTNAGMIVFDGFEAKGGNAPFVGGEVYPFDSVVIRANCKYTSAIQKEFVVQQLGDKWLTRAFTCNLTGSPAPAKEMGFYGTSSLQPPGFTNSKVGPVKLSNSLWNKYLNTSAYSYSQPTIKQ